MNEKERNQYLFEIGNRVKEIRIERGLSQDELAKRLGYKSRSSINKIELGINDIPQSIIKSIAEALNVPISQILCFDESNSERLSHESEVLDQIQTVYGKPTVEAVSLFTQLDNEDQGRTIERMETMLENEKYAPKD